jgi:hypothetical protein
MKKRTKKRIFLLRYLILIIFIVCAVAVILFVQFANHKITKKSFECRSDRDCAKVQTSCCSCNMGGNEVCAPLSKSEELKAEDCPADLMCIAMYNCKIKSCACIKGKCEGVPLE